MMKKKVLKRILALFLAVILSIPIAVTPAVPVSAGGVSEFFIDKMVDIGMRVACEGILTLSESAEASGYENVSKATAFVAKWGFMDAAEVAAVEAGKLCEEILAELEELEKVVNNNDAAIMEAVSEVQWLQGKNSLRSVKDHDIGTPITDLTGELEAFEEYVKVRSDFPSNPAEAEQKELDSALLNFLFALSANTSATPNKSSFESLGDAVFTTQEVSKVMCNAIDNLVAYLVKNPAGHDYNVMSTAMEYAYYYYPYSHQQYNYVMTQVKYQMAVIMEVMLMYNEFLALQYDYLERYVDINTTEGRDLYGNYNGWVEYLDNKMETLSENIVTMLDAEYQVSSKRSLSISDYMKPEDAKKTVLRGTNSDGSTYTYDSYKLMTNTDNSKKNVYYLYGYDTTLQWYGEPSGEVLDEFYRISAALSDGYNTYQMTSDASGFKELFNTNAFFLNGGTIRNNLYDFDSNGNAYSLISNFVTHLGTTAYEEYEEGLLNSNKEYYAEFQMIDLDKSFTSMDNFVTEAVNEDDTNYKAVVFAAKNTYSQNATAQISGLAGSDLILSSGSTSIGVGETKAIPSGDTVTIKFKLPEGCRNFTLECRRTYDTFSENTSRTSSAILLNEAFLNYLKVGEDGYYSLTYQMPYSECTFVLDANEFTYDEEGRIVISCYEDLKAAADQIKNNPSLYAGKSYIVTADITIPEDHTLEPIGTDNYPFTGTFDGQGYTISNLKFSTSYSKAGLFGVNKGTIKNLDFSRAEVSGESAGIAAGYSTGTLENIHVYSSTVNSSRQGGGICGNQSGGIISNCSVDSKSKIDAYCKANEENFATGGIVGKLSGTATVEKCTNAANIEHYADNSYINFSYTGGIIGLNVNVGTVQFCINTGSITCGSVDENHAVGGICGATMDSITISNCANRGNISVETEPGETGCPSYVGGVLGLYEMGGGSGASYIDSCYSAAQESVTFGYAGGIVCGGFTGSTNVTDCYYDSTLYSGGTNADMIVVKVSVTNSGGKTTEQFQSGEAAYLLNSEVTDGTQAWFQNLDNGETPDDYPILENNGMNTVYVKEDGTGYTNGTEILDTDSEGRFIITTYEELCKMAELVNSGEERYNQGDYILGNDITCPSDSEWTQLIGEEDSEPFRGTFDGQGYTIKGLNILKESGEYTGLFGHAEGAVIQNVYLSDVKVESATVNAGALCGKLSNGKILNCTVSGEMNLDWNVYSAGGICGIMESGAEMEKCINYSNITSHNPSYLGGVVGYIASADTGIIDCANHGTVQATDTSFYIGGVASRTYADAYVKNCYNMGTVVADNANSVGSVIGLLYQGITENCYYLDTTIADSTATAMTKQQFASGEVAYLLNSEGTDGTQAWYQNLDNGQMPDSYPTLDNNGENTVYAVRDNEGYSNFQYSGQESVLERVGFRTYQRVRDEEGKFTTESTFAYGYGLVDNENKTITMYASSKAERIGILMHQGTQDTVAEDPAGVMTLNGAGDVYEKFEETSKELLTAGIEEPDIYVDGNGCIFIKIAGKTDADIPELTITYEQLPKADYEPTEYTLTVKIIDVSQFASVGVQQTQKLDPNDPDYDVMLDDSVVVPTDPDFPFVDVGRTDWFYKWVKEVYEKDLMLGTSDTTFEPKMNLTREQFAMILYRMEGSPEAEYREVFPDITDGQWYTDAVMWASQTGVVEGYGDGTFGINDNITREQMILMMYRYAETKGYDMSQAAKLSGYPDYETVSDWAEATMKWAVANELIIGNEDGLLMPDGNVSRAECATIIVRCDELL